MSEVEKVKLKELQKILMSLYEEIEANSEQCENFQTLLDEIDGKADRIRWILEGGGG